MAAFGAPAMMRISAIPSARAMRTAWSVPLVSPSGVQYPDYQGVLCMLAPDPVVRSIETTRVEGATGAGETVAYKLVARQGQCVDGIRLELVNERVRGRMEPLVHQLGSDAIAVLEFPAEVGREGLTIPHPTLGLLSWHEPLPLLRSIHTRMETVLAQRESRGAAARSQQFRVHL